MTPIRLVAHTVCAAGLAALLGPAAAQQRPATRFDGIWGVDLSCEKAADGAFGYAWMFSAQVVNGQLHGEHGQRGHPSWMTLDGPIQSDGTALLVADGLTGQSVYNVGKVGQMLPFHYHVKTQFGAATGAGTRVETRPCSLTFTKN